MGVDEKKVARERMESFLDGASFVELNRLNGKANVLTGYGTADNRLVYVCAQYGAVNSAHAKKIVDLYGTALRMGAPVITFLDSPGVYLDEEEEVLEAYGEMFKIKAAASGVIPQISVVVGKCMGIAAYLAALSDFTFMSEGDGLLMLSPPDTLEGMDAKLSTNESLGGFGVHTKTTGLVCNTYKDESELGGLLRGLLSYLPSNNMERTACSLNTDDLNRADSTLNAALSSQEILESIADNRRFFEMNSEIAGNILTAFARFGGNSAAVIISRGLLEPTAAEKIVKLVHFCAAFGIPIITINDMGGYKKNAAAQLSMIEAGAKLIHAFAAAAVPKISVTLREGAGSMQLLLNSARIGADVHYVWESAGESGFTDAISPAETRKYLISALEMLFSKRVLEYPKKHGSFAR